VSDKVCQTRYVRDGSDMKWSVMIWVKRWNAKTRVGIKSVSEKVC